MISGGRQFTEPKARAGQPDAADRTGVVQFQDEAAGLLDAQLARATKGGTS